MRTAWKVLASILLGAVVVSCEAVAIAHHNNLLWDASDAGDQKAEEFIADRLACEWGFESGLAEERRASYGLKYVEALENWRDEKMYRQKMNLWRLLHDAGIA
jgi:hypothetical protein